MKEIIKSEYRCPHCAEFVYYMDHIFIFIKEIAKQKPRLGICEKGHISGILIAPQNLNDNKPA